MDGQQSVAIGIYSMPVFIIDNKYVVTGVQNIEVFVQAFEEANH